MLPFPIAAAMFACAVVANILEQINAFQEQLNKIEREYEELKIGQQQSGSDALVAQINDLKAQTEKVQEQMHTWWQDEVSDGHVEQEDKTLFDRVEGKAKILLSDMAECLKDHPEQSYMYQSKIMQKRCSELITIEASLQEITQKFGDNI